MTAAVRHDPPAEPLDRPVPRAPVPPHPKRWTKEEYYALVERGVFRGQHFSLFRGALIDMAPMGNPHAVCLMKANSVLTQVFPLKDFFVRVQSPFDAPGESVPEPDFAICTPEQAFVQPHPKTAALLIEVSDSSLEYDREKALEYAAAGVAEYWIVDLNDRCVEIYRNPVADRSAPMGFRYPPPTVARENEAIQPLSLGGVGVAVADLLP